jgi:hypothetical protein
MATKIKKQIKRSLPLFMIVCLLTSTAAIGLIFNFDLSIYKDADQHYRLSLGTAKAIAQVDMASTTVTVRNAPPTFSVATAENPASTSTSPVNVGGNIGFTARANDPENNNFYLLVCNSPGATAGALGAAPTCTGDTFCVSGSTLIGNQASCTYNNVSDPGLEVQVWYSYVCDNHGTEAACSDNYSQGQAMGSGDDSSPFHVNHRPVFSAAGTLSDYKNPGGTFTVRATSTDGDRFGSQDAKILYVCSTNGWTTNGCTGNTWCIGTSTANNIDCSFATTTPAKDGTWSYFTSVVLHSGGNIQLNIKGAPRVAATTTATITDNNGCGDIVAATSSIYWSSATSTYNCAANDNFCYKITSADCTY